jgi:hypothetical protein
MYCNFQLVSSRATYLKHADAIRSTSRLAITVQNACNWAQWIRVLTFILEDESLQKEKDHFVTGKAVPLQAWSGPMGFQEVKVPRFHDNGTGWW